MSTALLPYNQNNLTSCLFPWLTAGRFGHYDPKHLHHFPQHSIPYSHVLNRLRDRLKNKSNFDQNLRTHLATDWRTLTHGFNQQNVWHLNRTQMPFWRKLFDKIVSATTATTTTPFTRTVEPLIYQFESEIRYIPYPYMRRPQQQLTFGNTTNLFASSTDNIILPPKIRVIFMPMGPPPIPQSFCTGLIMPSFCFDRMWNWCTSFAIPPPLPQIASLPLSFNLQQDLMKRYQNPLAVVPLPAQWSPVQNEGTISALHGPIQSTNNNSYNHTNTYDGHLSGCRACPPSPPLLNVAAQNNQWVQRCCVCHSTPGQISQSNNGFSSGRITPLLGPTTISNATTPIQQYDHQQYPNIHQVVPTAPSPTPLPRLSFQPIDVSNQPVNYQQNPVKEQVISSQINAQYSTPEKTSLRTSKKRRKTIRNRSNENLAISDVSEQKPATAIEPIVEPDTISGGVHSDENTLDTKHILEGEAPYLRIRYRYQPKEFSSVYHRNRYLKSNSSSSVASSNITDNKNRSAFVLVKSNKKRQAPSSIPKSDIATNAENVSRSSSVSIKSNRSSKKLIIIREVSIASPSMGSIDSSLSEFVMILNKLESSSRINPKRDTSGETVSFNDV